MNNRISNTFIPYFLFALGLCGSTFFLMHRLGHAYISQWDEVVHVNVVHNLYADCCDPKLHSIDLKTDFEDTGDPSLKQGGMAWNNNYIWLHKPLLPFYLRAALYSAFGESLFVFRFPSALFMLLTAVCLFSIGSRLSSLWVATAAALLFASNEFVFELAQGRQFSDLSDVMNVFFLTIVLGLTLLLVAGRPLSSVACSSASIAAGLSSALAYFCKGGLVLPALAVFAVALVWQLGLRRGLAHVLVTLFLFCALIFPESFYFSHRFPQEFLYEQRQQIAHLFTDVEGWGAPWHYYITAHWWDVLGLPLGVSGMIAILYSGLRNRRNVLLSLWILSYLVPLSFGVSKVANFIAPVLPAVILLVAFCVDDLLGSERRTLLFSMIGIVLIVVLQYFNLLHLIRDFAYLLSKAAGKGLFILGAALCVLLVLRVLSSEGKVLGLAQHSVSPRLAVLAVALMSFGVIVQASESNWRMSNLLPANFAEQMALKATAENIKGEIPRGAVMLVDEASAGDHRNAHLYFQYWSGVNSIPAQQLDFAKRTLARTHGLFVLVKHPLGEGTLIGTVPFGYLYRID